MSKETPGGRVSYSALEDPQHSTPRVISSSLMPCDLALLSSLLMNNPTRWLRRSNACAFHMASFRWLVAGRGVVCRSLLLGRLIAPSLHSAASPLLIA